MTSPRNHKLLSLFQGEELESAGRVAFSSFLLSVCSICPSHTERKKSVLGLSSTFKDLALHAFLRTCEQILC
jgi:hypothetical protein